MWLVLNRLLGRCLANNDICCIGDFLTGCPLPCDGRAAPREKDRWHPGEERTQGGEWSAHKIHWEHVSFQSLR